MNTSIMTSSERIRVELNQTLWTNMDWVCEKIANAEILNLSKGSKYGWPLEFPKRGSFM